MLKTNKTNYETIEHYLQLPWTYTMQEICQGESVYFVICVNELPGVCTDALTRDEAREQIKEAMIAAFRMYMKQGEEIPAPAASE